MNIPNTIVMVKDHVVVLTNQDFVLATKTYTSTAKYNDEIRPEERRLYAKI